MDSSVRRLVIITGASRGIGLSAAKEFNKQFRQNSHFVLLARDLAKLNEAKEKLLKDGSNSVAIAQIDFSNESLKLDDYINILSGAIDSIVDFEELYVIYNHGTLENGSVFDVVDAKLKGKFETNFFSVWNLLAAVGKLLPETKIPKQFHVNINSSYAMKPVADWSVQCCSRTSRLMLFRCLAHEKPNLRVLSYDPGIVYTDMLKQAYEAENMFSQKFKEDYENNAFVTSEDSMINLIKVLGDNKFESGSCVEFAHYKLH